MLNNHSSERHVNQQKKNTEEHTGTITVTKLINSPLLNNHSSERHVNQQKNTKLINSPLLNNHSSERHVNQQKKTQKNTLVQSLLLN